jgi:hypothetical protein
MLTAERLRELLHYDPETGAFTWRPREVRSGAERTDKSWNSAHAGKEAGCVSKALGYRIIRIDQRDYYAHRLAFLYMKGRWPKGRLDHEDTDRSNNKWKNLRKATHSQNLANRGRCRTNTTGFKGVRFHKQRRRYTAQIVVNYKQHYLGLFDTPEEAHAAYCTAAEKHFGEFARP